MPLGNQRATLTVASKEISTAVESCDKCHYVYLGYVQINGNRPKLGMRHVQDGGTALVEFGGNAIGQTIDSIRAYEPRGWCVLHGRGECQNRFPTYDILDLLGGEMYNEPLTYLSYLSPALIRFLRGHYRCR